MSLKVKLVSCISAFIIVASLLLISVFAATNVTLNIGGNVSFTANSVNAYITGSIAGNAAGGDTLTPIDIDASDSDGAVSMPSDWTDMDLTFSESANPITVTINIQNRSTDRRIAVSLTDSTSISNVTVTRECDNVGISSTDTRNILESDTITYTFELAVQSQNSSASGDFSLSIGLENSFDTTNYYSVTLQGADYYAVDGGSFIKVNNNETTTVQVAERIIVARDVIHSGTVTPPILWTGDITANQFYMTHDLGMGNGRITGTARLLINDDEVATYDYGGDLLGYQCDGSSGTYCYVYCLINITGETSIELLRA